MKRGRRNGHNGHGGHGRSKRSRPVPKHRDPRSLITIGITPPELAPDTEAGELHDRLARRATRPPMHIISRLPWMSQARAYRAGYYLMTHGLGEHAHHPELEICNVPGAFVGAAADMLNEIADYVLNVSPVHPGETLQLYDDPFAVVGFRRIPPGTSGTVHDDDVLRVTFLC